MIFLTYYSSLAKKLVLQLNEFAVKLKVTFSINQAFQIT